MGRFFYLIIVLFAFGISGGAQASITADSIPELKKRPHFVFNFDTRYTLFENDPARISGLKAGLEWNERFRTGLGFYALSTPIYTKLPLTTPDGLPIEAQVKFRYGAVYGEYIILKNRKWEASVPVQLGYGQTLNVYTDSRGNVQRTDKVPIWLIEPSVSGHYKFYSWIGVGAGAGYRHMLRHPERETRRLNAPIYYVKVKLFAGELYKLLRQRYGNREN